MNTYTSVYLQKPTSILKKTEVTKQKYHKTWTFNDLLSVGDKVLKKNIVNESWKVKIEAKWTDPYTIVEGTAVGHVNSRKNMGMF